MQHDSLAEDPSQHPMNGNKTTQKTARTTTLHKGHYKYLIQEVLL
jgi:hypothetical protein